MLHKPLALLLLSLCPLWAQKGTLSSAHNFFPDNSVTVQAVNDPDAGVSIKDVSIYTDPGRKLAQIRFNLLKQDESVSKVFFVVTIVSPTGEVRSGEMWPADISGKSKTNRYQEPLRGEVTPGDHVVIHIGWVLKHGVTYKLPAITPAEFAALPAVPLQDRLGNDAIATPNIVCDYTFCENCNNLALAECKKGIQSYSCTIHPGCSCSYTCVQ
jgi:hypothetical protein